MDFVPEKSVLKVDEIRVGKKATGRLPSRPSGESASAEGAVEDVDDEVSPPSTTSEQKELALVHAVVCEELWPPIAEVALPFAVIVNFDAVPGLANATLLQRSEAISCPSIASTNWEGRRRQSLALASTGTMMVDHPSVEV
jgi:hypothetical protein